ncbi:sciellin-like [Kogia breviceps]|uniref:sciellin-like n=1 Tax=Kogia breviceps TaxID=27615 RepID=UPI0034D25ED9
MSNFTLRKTSPTGNDMKGTTQETALKQQGFHEVNKRRTFLQDKSWIKERPEEEKDENYGRVVLHRRNSHDTSDRKTNERDEVKTTVSWCSSDDTLDRNMSTFRSPEETKMQPGGLFSANATNTPASNSASTPVKKKRQSWFPPPPPGYKAAPSTGASRREPTVHPPIPPKPSSPVSSPNQLRRDNRPKSLENLIVVNTRTDKDGKGNQGLGSLIKVNQRTDSKVPNIMGLSFFMLDFYTLLEMGVLCFPLLQLNCCNLGPIRDSRQKI